LDKDNPWFRQLVEDQAEDHREDQAEDHRQEGHLVVQAVEASNTNDEGLRFLQLGVV